MEQQQYSSSITASVAQQQEHFSSCSTAQLQLQHSFRSSPAAVAAAA
jgi:hypothetical protein